MSKFIVKYSENQNTFDSHFTEKDIGFRTKNSDYFKKIVSFINTSIDQINFRIGTDGIYIISMDGSHIALLECFIPKEFFSTYNVDKELIIGINLNILMKILNHVKSNDELIFKIDYNKDIVNLLFINEKYTKYYKLKLLEIEQDNLEIVDLEKVNDKLVGWSEPDIGMPNPLLTQKQRLQIRQNTASHEQELKAIAELESQILSKT